MSLFTLQKKNITITKNIIITLLKKIYIFHNSNAKQIKITTKKIVETHLSRPNTFTVNKQKKYTNSLKSCV